jgi:hypothetical protein
MRDRLMELLSRVNPNTRSEDVQCKKHFRPGKVAVLGSRTHQDCDSSDDEEAIEFQRLETIKHNLLHELRIQSMMMNGRSRRRQVHEDKQIREKILEIEASQEKLN